MVYFLILVVLVSIIILYRSGIKNDKDMKDDSEFANYQKERNRWVDEQRKPKSKPVNTKSELSLIESQTKIPYYFIFDCETTGLPKLGETIRIVQLAWLILDENFNRVKEISYYLNPGIPIPHEAIAIHHITNEMVNEKATPHKSVLCEFYDDLEKSKWIVSHNYQYDAKCIDSETKIAKIKKSSLLRRKNTICTMLRGTDFCKLGPKRYGEYKWPKLEELAYACGIQVSGLHDASVDVRATGLCLRTMVDKNYIKKSELNIEFPKTEVKEFKTKYSELNIDLDSLIDFEELKKDRFVSITEIRIRQMERFRETLDLKKFYRETHVPKYPLPIELDSFDYEFLHNDVFRIKTEYIYKDGSIKFDDFIYRLEVKEESLYAQSSVFEEYNNVEKAIKAYVQILNAEELEIELFSKVIHRLSIILRKMKEYEHDLKLLEYAIERIQNTNLNYSGLPELEARLEKSAMKIKIDTVSGATDINEIKSNPINLPDDIESLKRLKENVRIKISKTKNRLDFQSEKKENTLNPMPEGNIRTKIEKRLAMLGQQKKEIELKIEQME
jgi:DNA polymerase III epsilon subunit-like protein